MDYFLLAVEIVSGIGVLVGGFTALWRKIEKQNKRQELAVEGQKCQLRSDMLHTYYKHHETKTIRQYEFENFLMLYSAYKALGGNSFIDKIHNEVIEWEIIT